MSLVKNSILYIVSTLFLKATSFILLPFYSHLVSPEEYGQVYVVTAFYNFMSILLLFSLNSVIQRFYFDCKNEYEIKLLFSNIVSILFFISTPILGILVCLHHSISEYFNINGIYLLIVIIATFFSLYYQLLIALLYASQNARKVSFCTIGIGCLGVIGQLLLVFNCNDKALALTLSILLSSFFSFIVFLVFSRNYITLPKFKKEKFFVYIKYGLSQWPSDICVWFVNFSDKIIINKYIGSSQTGIYGMGSTLGQIPQVLFHAINKAYVPYTFSNYKKLEAGDNTAMSNIVTSVTWLISVILLFVTFCVCFHREIALILSSEYETSSFVFVLILYAVAIDCFRVIFMNPMAYIVKYMKYKSAIWCLSALISISLNIILIPKYNMYGGCASLIISNSFTLMLILIFSNKALPIKYEIKKISLIILFSIILGIISCLNSNIIIRIGIFILYALILLKILGVRKRHLCNIITILKNK